MQELETPSDLRVSLDLGRLLGQRRAFAAVAGRCSAAHAQLLRRIHDEKLYLPVAVSWEAFCGSHLAISRRHADRLIALLNRFGSVYFELSLLVGITPREYVLIEPAVRDNELLVNGESISLVPENAPQLLEAVSHILGKSAQSRNRHRPRQTLRARATNLGNRARKIAHQLVALYDSANSPNDREFILELTAELRILLSQPGL